MRRGSGHQRGEMEIEEAAERSYSGEADTEDLICCGVLKLVV